MPNFRSVIARTTQLTVACVTLALAIPAGATTLDYQGYAYESGSFPPSEPGDVLRIPFVVTNSSLGVDLGTTELTGWIDGLVSSGLQDAGDGVQFYAFSAGTIEIWRDDARDANFGTTPPNATVPDAFRNGTACLTGTLTDFVLYIDGESNAGAYEGTVNFIDGVCLDELGASSAEGFTFGGVLTREAPSNIPEGFDFAIDGYLEAQKKPAADGCDFECMALTSARLDFPRHTPRRFGPKDGKFDIDGVFKACPDSTDLDPSEVEVQVRIGEYVQVLPEGALEREDRNEWRFSNERGTETLTKIKLEKNHNGLWEFELKGRGIERDELLPEGNLLEVELTLGAMSGVDDAVLVQKRHHLRFRERNCDCRGDRDDDDDDDDAPGLLAQDPASAGLLGATPNPFNATTTIWMRTTQAGHVSVRIFDVSGRRVRTLHEGTVAAGEHRFVWDGRNEHGAAVASGVFIYRVDAPGIAETRKLVVAK